jgi:hypothetical protein
MSALLVAQRMSHGRKLRQHEQRGQKKRPE